nr:MAG TPA: hypothetical protein [Bacteriophage sp.]
MPVIRKRNIYYVIHITASFLQAHSYRWIIRRQPDT